MPGPADEPASQDNGSTTASCDADAAITPVVEYVDADRRLGRWLPSALYT